VRLDHLELLRLEPSGLEQDRVGDRDLAEIVERRGLAHEPHVPVALPQVARHAGRERGDALRVLRRVVVAVLRRERQAPQRVDARLLRLTERAQDLPGHDRLQLAEPGPHLAMLEDEPELLHAPRAERLPVGDQFADGDHGRSRVEAERVQARAHRIGIGVAEADHHLRLRGRGLRRDEVDARHEIDRRAPRGGELGTPRLSRLPVPADNQDAGAGQEVVIHTET
jgi:hypothetical protein